MASFESFNFEDDPRWQSYLNSVEILADPTSSLQQLQRLKQKWYKKYVVSVQLFLAALKPNI